jgi:putative alpha-1,2-mannosidase
MGLHCAFKSSQNTNRMKFLHASLLLLAGLLAPLTGRAEKSPVDYVNLQIDTHKSRWFFFSSACRPFGMVNLSPDTTVGGDWLNGYLYGETNIQCFSHVHDCHLELLWEPPIRRATDNRQTCPWSGCSRSPERIPWHHS